MTDIFEPVLIPLNDRDRDQVLAAFAAVEHSLDPVSEAEIPGLRDATLRRCVEDMLHLAGRTLIHVDGYTWTSGYRDDVAADLVLAGHTGLSTVDRAVLVVVLILSVAIPRANGELQGDSWLSPFPAPFVELRDRTHIAAGELKAALSRLRAAGLIKNVTARGKHASGETGYIPGPQFHRLTPAARRRLQEELILAAGPSSPLAAAIRSRRGINK